MHTAVVLFTRDLRVHDHAALAAAAREAAHVVPLFVLDDGIVGTGRTGPNRAAFLLEALRDLDGSLAARGAGLVVRRGEVVDQVGRVVAQTGAGAVHASADISAYAQARQRRLAAAHDLRLHPGVTVVVPGALTPAGGDHYKVFTPYWRAWQAVPPRRIEPPPQRLRLPPDLHRGVLPGLDAVAAGAPSPERVPGGEGPARQRLEGWLRDGLARYAELADDLAADDTSRLSPALHFGCLSPGEVAALAREATADGTDPDRAAGAEAFVRQLCWRDFHHQVLAARPASAWRDYRSRGDRWDTDPAAFTAWAEGRTGYPIVDAAMRQLRREGFMPNRARLIAASFLTKDLYLDWRLGASHFLHWLVDGDVANNQMNWQWVAGTGNDTRPHRMLNPLRQAERFDPDGTYVRRYVPELAGVDGKAVHRPWLLGPRERGQLDYPEPMVDHEEAVARFRAARDLD
ncbi:MAG: deoxyribodipyrimidine photo-lyase [Egibacteraceae bacterium]